MTLLTHQNILMIKGEKNIASRIMNANRKFSYLPQSIQFRVLNKHCEASLASQTVAFLLSLGQEKRSMTKEKLQSGW